MYKGKYALEKSKQRVARIELIASITLVVASLALCWYLLITVTFPA